jgi:flagellar basal-body rod protein FlgF
MDNTQYINLSHLTALRRQMDIVANNIANMSTTAYKGEKPLFSSFIDKAENGETINYVQDFGVVRNLKSGTITPTGNPLDIAINGEGYFQVQTKDGIRYTRAGNFSLDTSGQLTTRDGLLILDNLQNKKPISIPQGTKNITISQTGEVNADNTQVGSLAVVTFDNERDLKKLENGLYETTQQPKPVTRFELHQGMIEGSNVQPILEMAEMINVSRNYEQAQKFLDTEDQRQRKAVSTLSGTSAQ